MKQIIKGAIIGFAAMCAGSTAYADNLLTNGSFETGTLSNSSFSTLNAGSTAITGWTVGGNSVDYIGNYWQTADGSRSLDMSGGNAGSISQLISTAVGQMYNVSFSLAGNPDSQGIKNLLVSIGGSLYDGAFSFDSTGKSRTAMGWTTASFTFTGDGQSHALVFASSTATAYGPALDNVSMTAVPGPIAGAGLPALLGLMGFSAWRRRQSRHA